MIEHKTVNGVKLRVDVLVPQVDNIFAVHMPGATVKEIGEKAGADIAINFNYADTAKGLPIGRVIVDGKVVVQDIPKTVARDELYMLPDKSLHIGKAPANAVWALQGSPPLLRNGAAMQGGIERDQLGKDVWDGAAFRTAAGITADGKLVLVRTYTEIFLPQLTTVMLELGCVDALNGDGGGSSYMWPADSGWGRKLGAALVAKRRESKVKKLIALDDGHGMETPGKRTPVLPDGTKSPDTGANFMHENEFNRAVVALLGMHLARCGFDVLFVAPSNADTRLEARTDLANNITKNGFNRPADLYCSVHANAMTGIWGNSRGIETLVYKFGGDAEKAAGIVHKQLLQGTPFADRKVQERPDLWVLKGTNMPAFLVECGFMDNLQEAKLLLTGTYRAECAAEIAKGICQYFGVSFVDEQIAPPSGAALPVIQRTVNGRLNGAVVTIDSYLINDTSYAPLKFIAEAHGSQVEWDKDKFEYDLITKGK